MNVLVKAVMWPPGYYIWRDRVPFFLTILYLVYRDPPKWLPQTVFKTWGWYLTCIVALTTGIALRLHLEGRDMSFLAGIRWSAPSPIEWGILILACVATLYSRGIPIFESFYLSLITAMGGGWLYEFFPLLFQGNFRPMVFFKVNAVKVFFIEFQLFCLPILAYLIKTTKRFKPSRFLVPIGTVAFLFYALNAYVIEYVQANLIYSYRWYVRLPAIAFLYTVIYGVWPNE